MRHIGVNFQSRLSRKVYRMFIRGVKMTMTAQRQIVAGYETARVLRGLKLLIRSFGTPLTLVKR